MDVVCEMSPRVAKESKELCCTWWLKVQLERQLYLPALIDGVRDLSEGRHSELSSRFVKLRCIEEVDEFGAIVQRTVAARQAKASAQRDVPIRGSVLPERIHAQIAASSRRNVGIKVPTV